MEEIISVSLPDIPDSPEDSKFSKALLGGEISFYVDEISDESTKLKRTKELLVREAEAAGQLEIPAHIVPYARAACEIAAEENDNDFHQEERERLFDIQTTASQAKVFAQQAAGKRKAQCTNGFNQAHHLRTYNAENTSEEQRQELNAAVQLDKKQYPDPSKQRPHGYWKDLLSHAPSYPSAEALRKAVMRKRDDKRGQYKREGKKRGPYIKRV